MAIGTRRVTEIGAVTQKHKQDVDLLIGSHMESFGSKSKYGEAFKTRVQADIRQTMLDFLAKQDAIRASGRYSAEGERAELVLAARAVLDKLKAVRTATVEPLDKQLAEKRAGALASKPSQEDATLRFLRLKEIRQHIAQMDPLQREALVRQAMHGDGDADLIAALESAPKLFPVVPHALLDEAKAVIAEREHPELGELAQLRDAYHLALGYAEQILQKVTGADGVELHSSAPIADTRPPIFGSDAQEAQA